MPLHLSSMQPALRPSVQAPVMAWMRTKCPLASAAPKALFDSTTAVKAGKMVGAEYVVVGAFAAVDPQMRIDTRIVRVATGEIVKTAQVTGSQDKFFDLEKSLADRLIDGLGITLDPEEILPWAKENGLPEDLGALAEAEQVQEMVQKELDRANSNYAQVEQIKKFRILDHDLAIDSGELTPTLKVKRNVVYDRYGDVFESMYG